MKWQKCGTTIRHIWYFIFLPFVSVVLFPRESLALPTLLGCSSDIQLKGKEVKSISGISAVQCASRGQLKEGSTFVVWEHSSQSCKVYERKTDSLFNKAATSCAFMRCLVDKAYGTNIDDFVNCLSYKYESGVRGEIYLNMAGDDNTPSKYQEKYNKKQADIVKIYQHFKIPCKKKYTKAVYEMTALFKPSKTGVFYFGLQCDSGEVLLSMDEEEDNLKLILKAEFGNEEEKTPIMSNGIHLFEHLYYLLRGTFKQPSKCNEMTIGVKFEKEGYTTEFGDLFHKMSWKTMRGN